MSRRNLYFINHVTFDKYFISTYYVPDTVLDTGYITVNKTDENTCPHRTYNLLALWIYKHLKT